MANLRVYEYRYAGAVQKWPMPVIDLAAWVKRSTIVIGTSASIALDPATALVLCDAEADCHVALGPTATTSHTPVKAGADPIAFGVTLGGTLSCVAAA